MRHRRIIKQIIYGVLYLLIIFAVLFTIYAVNFQPEATCSDGKKNQGEEEIDCGGPCQSCALNRLEDLIALPGIVISSVNPGYSTLVVQLQNPNPHYGAKNFEYQAQFFSVDDELLYEFGGESFLYPGEIRTLIEPNIEVDPKLVNSVRLLIEEPRWAAIEEYQKPDTQVRDVKVEIEDEELRSKVIVTGIFRNENPYSLSRVSLSVQLRGEIGELVTASKTTIENVSAFGERRFEIISPIFPDQIVDLHQKARIIVEAQR